MARGMTPWYASAGVAAAATGVYMATTQNTVGGGDSGELLSVAWDFGVAHPPGYPLWVILSWTLAAVSPAWGMYLLSPIAGGLCAGAVHATVHLATGSHAAGVLAAAVQALAPATWQWSTTAEVFALNNLCCAVLLYCGVRYIVVPSKRSTTLLYTAFATALALANQQTSVVFIVPSAALILTHYVAFSDGFDTEKIVVLFLSGCVFVMILFLLYFQLFASTWFNTGPHVWGAAFDMNGVVTHMLRKEYGTFSLAQERAGYAKVDFWGSLENWTMHTVKQVPAWVLGLALVGLVAPVDLAGLPRAAALDGDAAPSPAPAGRSVGKKEKGGGKRVPKNVRPTPAVASRSVAVADGVPDRDRYTLMAVQVLLLTCLVSYLTFFGVLGNLPLGTELFRSVQERFWLQPYLVLAIGAGMGLAKALSLAGGLLRRAPTAASSTPAPVPPRTRIADPAALAAVLAWVFVFASGQWDAQDRRGRTWVEDFGVDLLRPLKPNAVLFTKGDIVTNSVRFAQTVRGYRTDVKNVDIEMLRSDWYVPRLKAAFGDAVAFPGTKYSPKGGFNAEKLITANIDRAPVYLAYDFVEADRSWKKVFTPIPAGIADELVRTSDMERWTAGLHKGVLGAVAASYPGDIERNFNASRASDASPREPWEGVVAGDYWASLYRAGDFLARKANDLPSGKKTSKQKREANIAALAVLQHVLDHGKNHTSPLVRTLTCRTVVAVAVPMVDTAADAEGMAALMDTTMAAINEFVALAPTLPDHFKDRDVNLMRQQQGELVKMFNARQARWASV